MNTTYKRKKTLVTSALGAAAAAASEPALLFAATGTAKTVGDINVHFNPRLVDGCRRRSAMMTSRWGLGQPGDREAFLDGDHRYAMWDAAYVLGSLAAGDRREFETHLADCPACRQAVVEISGMPAMLSQLDGNDIAG